MGDVLKIYIRRLLKVIPMYYITFLVGWFVIPHTTSGPVWYMYEKALFY
jgi:peptidoglycan/LPS O-acetylase OafA/YrhL